MVFVGYYLPYPFLNVPTHRNNLIFDNLEHPVKAVGAPVVEDTAGNLLI